MRRGFTFIELTVVILVVAVLAVLAAPRAGSLMTGVRLTAAERDLAMLREALTDADRGLLRDVGHQPGFLPSELRLADLMIYTNRFARWDADRECGWRGPYVKANGQMPEYAEMESVGLLWRGDEVYGLAGEPAVLDPWGTPYVLQVPIDEDNGRSEVSEEERLRFARVVSAGPNRRLETPYDRFTNLCERAENDGDDLVAYLLDPETPERR